jgi:hypothetical protein
MSSARKWEIGKDNIMSDKPLGCISLDWEKQEK